jgi:hypothetical protein
MLVETLDYTLPLQIPIERLQRSQGQPLVELAETLAYSNPFVPEGDIGRNGLDFRVHQWIKIL